MPGKRISWVLTPKVGDVYLQVKGQHLSVLKSAFMPDDLDLKYL